MKTLKQKERADDRTEFENDNSQNNEQNAVAKFILTTWNSALLPFWPWKCWCEFWHMWTSINPLWMQRWTAEHRAQPFRLPFACFWQLADFNPFTRNYRICAMSGLWFLDRSNEFHFSSIFIHTRDEMRVCGILHHVCDLSQAQQIFVFVVIVKYNALRVWKMGETDMHVFISISFPQPFHAAYTCVSFLIQPICSRINRYECEVHHLYSDGFFFFTLMTHCLRGPRPL